jgi:hypothetical protein
MPDGTIYEEEWEEGECIRREIKFQPKKEEKKPDKEKAKNQLERKKRNRVGTSVNRRGLEFSLDSSVKAFQYVNEKLLNKNSKLVDRSS